MRKSKGQDHGLGGQEEEAEALEEREGAWGSPLGWGLQESAWDSRGWKTEFKDSNTAWGPHIFAFSWMCRNAHPLPIQMKENPKETLP